MGWGTLLRGMLRAENLRETHGRNLCISCTTLLQRIREPDSGFIDQRFSKCGPGPEALSWNLLEMRNQKSGDEGQQSVV